MSGDLGLALAQNSDQIADADFSPRDQVEEAQTRSIGEGRKERDKIGGLGPRIHASIIYALTDMSSARYIRIDVYEGPPWTTRCR